MSDPQESGPLIPPARETKDIYKVDRFGERILWRGVFGGVAGYWLLVMLLWIRSSDYYVILIILCIHFSIVSGAVGFFIGGALRLYYRKHRRNLEIIMRVVVGVSLATLIIGIAWCVAIGSFNVGIVPLLTSSVFIGGLSGLVARIKKAARSSPAAEANP